MPADRLELLGGHHPGVNSEVDVARRDLHLGCSLHISPPILHAMLSGTRKRLAPIASTHSPTVIVPSPAML